MQALFFYRPVFLAIVAVFHRFPHQSACNGATKVCFGKAAPLLGGPSAVPRAPHNGILAGLDRTVDSPI
jgi:hypothetical protein